MYGVGCVLTLSVASEAFGQAPKLG